VTNKGAAFARGRWRCRCWRVADRAPAGRGQTVNRIAPVALPKANPDSPRPPSTKAVM